MAMHDKMKSPPGWRPSPKTPLQWHQQWTTEKIIWVPTRRGRATHIQLESIEVPIGLAGNPDLLMTSTAGKRFYVLFRRDCAAFTAMDLPLLVYPPEAGLRQAFWVLPGR